MAIATQRPDASSYKFDPYQIDISGVANAINSRTNLWLQGAAQVKSAYERAAGMSLSHESSKQKLREYMKTIDQNMESLLKKDVSIGDNVQEGLNMFKPLYEDETLTVDNQITEYYQKQNKLAESAKTKDGGKYYDQISHAYMNDHYQTFLGETDPAKWKDHWNNKKGYTPYYDEKPEVENILKHCKADEAESQTPLYTPDGKGTLYFSHTKSMILSENKLRACFENFSDNAKNKFYREGYIRYNKDYAALGNDYVQMAGREVLYGKERLEAASGAIAGLDAKIKAGTATETDLAKLEYYTKEKERLSKNIHDLETTQNSILAGDLSYVKENYEKLAGAAFYSKKIGGYTAFQNIKTSNKVEEDNAAMLIYKTVNEQNAMVYDWSQKRQMNAENNNFDLLMAKLELTYGGKGGKKAGNGLNSDGTLSDPTQYPEVETTQNEGSTAADGSKLVQEGVEFYNQTVGEMEELKKKSVEVDSWIDKKLRVKPEFAELDRNRPLVGSTAFVNYINAHPNDPDVKQWLTAKNTINSTLSINMELVKNAMKSAARLNPELFDPSKPNDDPKLGFLGSDGKSYNFTPEEIQNAYKGNHKSIKIVSGGGDRQSAFLGHNKAIVLSTPTGMVRLDPVDREGFKLGKVDYFLREGDPSYIKMDPPEGSNSEKRLNAIVEEFGKYKRASYSNMKDISRDNNNENTFYKSLGTKLNLSPEEAKKRIFLKNSDLAGKVIVTIKNPEEGQPGPLKEDVLTELKKFYKGVKLLDQDGFDFEIEGVKEYTFFNSNPLKIRQLMSIDALISAKESILNKDGLVEVPLMSSKDNATNNSTPEFKLIVSKGPLGQLTYSVKRRGENGMYSSNAVPVPDPAAALILIDNYNAR